MTTDLREGMTRVVPMVSYEDVAAMVEWLAKAFGFAERERYTDPDGTVSQAEMVFDGGVIMVGKPGPDYQSPRRHAEACDLARKWSETPYVIDGVLVYVDDVDSHFERAKAVGATILSEPEDMSYGDRRYRAEDPEGHRWMFSHPL